MVILYFSATQSSSTDLVTNVTLTTTESPTVVELENHTLSKLLDVSENDSTIIEGEFSDTDDDNLNLSSVVNIANTMPSVSNLIRNLIVSLKPNRINSTMTSNNSSVISSTLPPPNELKLNPNNGRLHEFADNAETSTENESADVTNVPAETLSITNSKPSHLNSIHNSITKDTTEQEHFRPGNEYSSQVPKTLASNGKYVNRRIISNTSTSESNSVLKNENDEHNRIKDVSQTEIKQRMKINRMISNRILQKESLDRMRQPYMINRLKLAQRRNYRKKSNRFINKHIYPLPSYKQRFYRNKLRAWKNKNEYHKSRLMNNFRKPISRNNSRIVCSSNINNTDCKQYYVINSSVKKYNPIKFPSTILAKNNSFHNGKNTFSNIAFKVNSPRKTKELGEARKSRGGTSDNEVSAIDAFMMIPLCAEVRRMNQKKHRNELITRNTTEVYLKSKQRKLKMYKMLKRIMKPRYMNSRKVQHRYRKKNFNKYFNRKLWRVLRKLFQRRKEKLRSQPTMPRNISRTIYQRRVRKVNLIDSIRRYRLNRIFKLFRISIYNPYLDIKRSDFNHQNIPKTTTPILCIAAKRITNQYRAQRRQQNLSV